MSRNELTAYLWSLRLTRLSEPKRVFVYAVPGSGAVKVHKQLLRKGERVFVTSEGKLALRAICGNPLGEGPANKLNTAFSMPSP